MDLEKRKITEEQEDKTKKKTISISHHNITHIRNTSLV